MKLIVSSDDLDGVRHALVCVRNELSSRLDKCPSMPKQTADSITYSLGKVVATLHTIKKMTGEKGDL